MKDIDKLKKLFYGDGKEVISNIPEDIISILHDMIISNKFVFSNNNKYIISINKVEFIFERSLDPKIEITFKASSKHKSGHFEFGWALYEDYIHIPISEFKMKWRNRQIESIGI